MKRINKKSPTKKKYEAKDSLPFLELLSSYPPLKRKKLIDLAENQEILAICECIDNVMKGHVPLAPDKLSLLKTYKNYLRFLSGTRRPLRKRKEILKQHGGFLPLLIPAALTILKTLLYLK